jgi:redox-sensitive bicupin YhaK (pirin superfamily)
MIRSSCWPLDIGDRPLGEPHPHAGFETVTLILDGVIYDRREAGVEARIYSDASGSLRSTTRNHVPVTMTEITMDPHTSIDQELPTSYNGFAYLIVARSKSAVRC